MTCNALSKLYVKDITKMLKLVHWPITTNMTIWETYINLKHVQYFRKFSDHTFLYTSIALFKKYHWYKLFTHFPNSYQTKLRITALPPKLNAHFWHVKQLSLCINCNLTVDHHFGMYFPVILEGAILGGAHCNTWLLKDRITRLAGTDKAGRGYTPRQRSEREHFYFSLVECSVTIKRHFV